MIVWSWVRAIEQRKWEERKCGSCGFEREREKKLLFEKKKKRDNGCKYVETDGRRRMTREEEERVWIQRVRKTVCCSLCSVHRLPIVQCAPSKSNVW